MKVNPFGAFVELDKDIHGLVHISELSNKKVNDPENILKPGEEYDFTIINIEPKNHRLGLSYKTKKVEDKKEDKTKEAKEDKKEETKEEVKSKDKKEETKKEKVVKVKEDKTEEAKEENIKKVKKDKK